MFRKFAAVLALVVAALFLSVGISSADTVASSNYPPTSVVATSQTVATTPAAVLGTSQDVAGNLSYTGSGINVGLFVVIGALVLLLGVGLTVVGTRMSRSRSANHS